MNSCKRAIEPDCYKAKKALEKKKAYYEKISNSNKISELWNYSICKENDINLIRKSLLEATNSTCAYCGKYINIDDTQVEHYLPKIKFRYLSYSFANYLPSCSTCNNKKGDYCPDSLNDKEIVDGLISEKYKHDYVIGYDLSEILEKSNNNRLFNTYYDKAETHFDFNPKSLLLKGKTKIGELTVSKLFLGSRGYAEDLKRKSESVRNVIKWLNKNHISSENYEEQKTIIIQESYSFLSEKLFSYYESLSNLNIN